MKGGGFSDRAKQWAELFQDWNSCEQTIALYSLLSKVSATQARFFSLVLEHSLKNACDSQELGRVEKQANNAAYLSSLHSQTEETALTHLLSHLPLLNPGSSEARKEYMKLLPKVLLGSSEELDYLDKCRQLLSLALVHPAFPHEDREALTYWLTRLDDKQKNIMDRKFYVNGRPPARIYQQSTSSADDMTIRISGWSDSQHAEPNHFEEEERRMAATLGLGHSNLYLSSSNGHDLHQKSNSLPVQCVPMEWKQGMKDMPMWLKSLRLHKYDSLFADLSYEEMLQITEEQLEEKKVTKGARNKILLNIQRLVRRPEALAQLEQDMEKHGRLLECIDELKSIVQTPIKPFSQLHHRHPQARLSRGKEEGRESGDEEGEEEEEKEGSECSSPSSSSSAGLVRSCSVGSDLDELLTREYSHDDLPSLLTRAFGKAYNQLMLHTETNEDNLSSFISLMDMGLGHQAFTNHQKQLFLEWQQQCQQSLKVCMKKPSQHSSAFKSWVPGCSFTYHGTTSHTPSRVRTRVVRPGTKIGGQAKGMTLPNLSRSSSTLPRMSNTHQLQQPFTSLPKPFHSGSAGFSTAPASYQPQPPPIPPRSNDPNHDTYLYDLCKRVTEQALPDDLSDS